MGDFLNKLFRHPGKKIKALALGVFITESVGGIIGSFFLFADTDLAVFGLLCLIGAPLAAFALALPLYGFGQLVENSERNRTTDYGYPPTLEAGVSGPKFGEASRYSSPMSAPPSPSASPAASASPSDSTPIPNPADVKDRVAVKKLLLNAWMKNKSFTQQEKYQLMREAKTSCTEDFGIILSLINRPKEEVRDAIKQFLTVMEKM